MNQVSTSSNSDITLQFRSFEAQILYFNGMYTLPVAAYPSTGMVVVFEAKDSGLIPYEIKALSKEFILKRLEAFKKVISDEVLEIDDIIERLSKDEYQTEIDFLTDMADWLGDLQVYCASEMARYGIPYKETLDIIMQSNFSKLGEDGKPIIAEGKVQKGPFYWKPEPKLHAMLYEKQKDFFYNKAEDRTTSGEQK